MKFLDGLTLGFIENKKHRALMVVFFVTMFCTYYVAAVYGATVPHPLYWWLLIFGNFGFGVAMFFMLRAQFYEKRYREQQDAFFSTIPNPAEQVRQILRAADAIETEDRSKMN